MKAKDLIPILQLNPEADASVSTVKYYENHYTTGYKRGETQTITNVSIDSDNGIIYLEGGTERRI